MYADRVGLRANSAGEADSTKSPWMRFWAPHRLAWWVAVTFMVGSLFFVLGAAGSLVPGFFGGQHPMTIFAEACYFIGALLYTASIYAQLLESINVDSRVEPSRDSHPPRRFRWFALELTRLEFLTPFVLLIGSVVFNYETTFALGSTVDLLPKLGVWETSLLGALLFLAAGFLQFIEAGHGYVSFAPRDVSWWVGVSFIAGSLGFIVGALPGLGTPGLPSAEHGSGPLIVKVGFLLGGIAFLVGSYLMLPELFIQLRARRQRG